MIFDELSLAGAYLIAPDRATDARGSFGRFYCEDEFASHGLADRMVQGNLSYSAKAGTLRGMHYQVPPVGEAKFIRVLHGAIYDVIVDLRPWSTTFLQHGGVELSAESRVGIYVPPYFGHGHQALTDEVEIAYLVSERYTPGAERGLRHDDEALDISWPLPISVISEKDLAWAPLDVGAIQSEMASASPPGRDKSASPNADSRQRTPESAR
ncbi:MAG: dTDP-4-dehydrorhamnose 3,5-epimerase family protein [Acidimicrobiales bacterium]